MREQLNKIWKTYYPQLLNFVRRKISDKSIAEDIVQDVFLKAQLKFETLKNPAKVRSWLFQITRNSIIDYYRREKPLIRLEENILFSESAEEDNANKRLQKNVLTMICKLPVKYCEAIRLADYHGLKQTDIAKELGISLSGAKSRVQRARKMMKEIYTSCCHFEFDIYGNVIDYYPH